MALKDWKKIQDTRYMLAWKNKNKLKYFVTLDYHIPKKQWIFEVVKNNFAKNGYGGIKTKKQALAYAKAYMRKH